MFLNKLNQIKSAFRILTNLSSRSHRSPLIMDPPAPPAPPTSQDPPTLSKNALRKLEKEKEKEAKRAQHKAEKQSQNPQGQGQTTEKEEKENELAKNYGDLPLVQSQERTEKKWLAIRDVNDSKVGTTVLIRARLSNIRAKKTIAFLIFREAFYTLQAVAAVGETVSKKMIEFIQNIPKESLVDLEGVIVKPEQEILSCTQKFELQVSKIFVVSRAEKDLPFQIEDASRVILHDERDEQEEYDTKKTVAQPEEEKKEEKKDEKKDDKTFVKVHMKTRLDNRIMDLRTQAKQAIFRLSSGVCQLFREFLLANEFIEIHTPKLIGGTSEGGSNVFKLKYFDKEGCLAQSPQLYKQMCVMSDFQRVFEIGPVFRAEYSFTHRHMCEFTGVDLEMTIKEHYFELLDFMADMFVYLFEGLEKKFASELKAISLQYPFEPFVCKNPVLKLTFQEACQLLGENGVEQSEKEDFSTEIEKKLGVFVKAKYGTDFYMVYKYPIAARPFYTMLCKDDPEYTNSYDFFMRGEEITSGSQRIHDPVILAQRAKECGIAVETIQPYINAFKYGAYPHGGCGIGLERVIMLYCALGNIRNSSMFPRDPNRIFP